MLKCWLTSMKVLIGHLYIAQNLLYMERKEAAKQKVWEIEKITCLPIVCKIKVWSCVYSLTMEVRRGVGLFFSSCPRSA